MFSAVVGLNLPMVATASRRKALVVMSGAHLLDLKEGKAYAAGYYLNELYTPLAALVETGYTLGLRTQMGTLFRRTQAPTMLNFSVVTMLNGWRRLCGRQRKAAGKIHVLRRAEFHRNVLSKSCGRISGPSRSCCSY
jgi:hypothetical protein